ncbi:MAG: hypothetical protein CVU00_08820 [Bacteroidetes bacterium HGW-Bacteroidetes-17]|jgi:hypothetical protein|nr:MAG: hypothetical protein CVU00_08820 [Bacteroidetes bacterium HGW-Bacteroidetes-17]
MKLNLFIPTFLLASIFSNSQNIETDFIIQKGKVIYDFSFAELAIKYLECGDSTYLNKIANLPATEHLLNHAIAFKNNIPHNSGLDFVISLLTPFDDKKKILHVFKSNLRYAKTKIAEIDLPQKTCLKFLPTDFHYSSNLFFTFGYDIGVVFGNNASLNLAHPHYVEHQNEIKYYSIHELHHAGFVTLKNNAMPSLDINKYKEMTDLIAYFTHLEGMGTYVPLTLRKKEGAMENDKDYIAIQDTGLMRSYESAFFEIYFHFKNNPNKILNNEDWDKLSVLSDDKRLWYRVGAKMAQTIDERLGREKLVKLISEPSTNFINTYLLLKED